MPLDRQTLHVTSQLSSGIWQVQQMQPAFHSPNRPDNKVLFPHSPPPHALPSMKLACMMIIVEKKNNMCTAIIYHSTEAHNKAQHELASVLKGY